MTDPLTDQRGGTGTERARRRPLDPDLPLFQDSAVASPVAEPPVARLDEPVQAVPDRRGFRLRRCLAASDLTMVAVAFALSAAVEALTRFDTAQDHFSVMAPVALALWLAIGALTGMFHVDERRIDLSTSEEIGRMIQAVALWVWVVFLIDTLGSQGPLFVTPAAALWVLCVPLFLLGRWSTRRLVAGRRWFSQRAIVVGGERDARRVCDLLRRHPEFAIEIVDSVDIRPFMPQLDYGSTMATSKLLERVGELAPDRIIFASSYEGLDEDTGALRFLVSRGYRVDLVPADSDVFRSDAELHHVEGLPFLTLPMRYQDRSSKALKRSLDIAVSTATLILGLPLLAAIALRIKLDSRGPVLFRQQRVGRHGEFFELLKFRTMVDGADEQKATVDALNDREDGMFKIDGDPRITAFGAKLRNLSLDELPQLVNVLRGDMSLVGPRPLIAAESDLVSEDYRMRSEVLPGITGPWQVLGRSDIPFSEMLKLDYTYVVNWSMGEDLKLLVRTAGAISHGRGAY